MNQPVPCPFGFPDRVRDLLGPKGWTRDPDILRPRLTDWRGRYTGRAFGLATPASTCEVASLVRLCAQHNVSIVAQGGNTSMSGGATPDDTGASILLNLARMNAARWIDTAGKTIVCEAGMVLQDLHDAAARHDLRFPLTLGGKGSATIGGLIATNAGGTQVLRHGTMRAQVLGLEAVMADGQVLDLLANLKKDNRGFDLKQLLIGSEGTLGIVTAARLRLLPAIGSRVVAWAGVASPGAAASLLELFTTEAGELLEGFEIIPDSSLEAVLEYLPAAKPPFRTISPWHVLIEFAASSQASRDLRDLVEHLAAMAMERGLASDAIIAQNETQAEALWTLRDNISPAERARGPAMQHDIAVPVERMAAFMEHAIPELERRFPGTRALAFGHLGDGNVHFHVQAPRGSEAGPWEMSDGSRISAAVHDLVVEWGGSISAEHGIGQMKLAELERLHDPVALGVMRAVKQALDPRGLLNPDKLIRANHGASDTLAPAKTVA